MAGVLHHKEACISVHCHAVMSWEASFVFHKLQKMLSLSPSHRMVWCFGKMVYNGCLYFGAFGLFCIALFLPLATFTWC